MAKFRDDARNEAVKSAKAENPEFGSARPRGPETVESDGEMAQYDKSEELAGNPRQNKDAPEDAPRRKMSLYHFGFERL